MPSTPTSPPDEVTYELEKLTLSSSSTPVKSSNSPLLSTPSKSPSILLRPSAPSTSTSNSLSLSLPTPSPLKSQSPTPLSSPSILYSPSTPSGARLIKPFPLTLTPLSSSSPSTPFTSSSLQHVNVNVNVDGDYRYDEEITHHTPSSTDTSPSPSPKAGVAPLVLSKVRTLTFNVSLPPENTGYGLSTLTIPPSPALVWESEPEEPETPKKESYDVEGSHYAVACRKGKRKGKGKSIIEDTHKVMTLTLNVFHPTDNDSLDDSKVEFEDEAEDVSFFGVFDGHGGRKAADFAAENIGKNIVNALLRATEDKLLQTTDDEEEDYGIEQHIINKNDLLDQKNLEEAVKAGYLRTDDEFLKQGVSGGTTCVTALIIGGKLVVSNAGDCRAVISRRRRGNDGGEAEALTCDHKVAREDEQERIEKLGGLVLRCGGVPRIGSLAVSRGIGDSDYKEWVTSEPDTTILEITSSDEFLILATDGLWDVVSNQEAVDIARPFCVDTVEHGGGRATAGPLAAAEKLVEVAVARNSHDDITAMIIQLQRFS